MNMSFLAGYLAHKILPNGRTAAIAVRTFGKFQLVVDCDEFGYQNAY